jgi:hypothetical protein
MDIAARASKVREAAVPFLLETSARKHTCTRKVGNEGKKLGEQGTTQPNRGWRTSTKLSACEAHVGGNHQPHQRQASPRYNR